ncbi:MAG TPA: hypothetical protein VLW75_10305 [Rhizomicrobium sp.]|nr:hypothetical protein [Rhizomicrobium sp.]
MRSRIILLAGAFALMSGAAMAEDPMMNTYDNTITTKNTATGVTGTLLFDKDMTYTAKGTDKDGKPAEYKGTWAIKDDGKTICLTPTLPPDMKDGPKPSCSPFEEHKVGDSWQVTNDQNETYEVSLTAGR